MVQMDYSSLRERELAVDLECGMKTKSNGEEGPSTNYIPRSLSYGVSNGFVGSEGSYRNGEGLSSISIQSPLENEEGLLNNRFGGNEVSQSEKKKAGKEKQKKKGSKKPPRPPRPPRTPSIDTADQKLVREISELAKLKKAKIERMKALQKMKNVKSSSSNTNLLALVITVLFCLMIIWQGFFQQGVGSNVSFQGSPSSSASARSGFISVQFYKNMAAQHDSSSASPSNVDLVSGLDDHGKSWQKYGIINPKSLLRRRVL